MGLWVSSLFPLACLTLVLFSCLDFLIYVHSCFYTLAAHCSLFLLTLPAHAILISLSIPCLQYTLQVTLVLPVDLFFIPIR